MTKLVSYKKRKYVISDTAIPKPGMKVYHKEFGIVTYEKGEGYYVLLSN